MAIQKETRILKSNTIEELRQKSNEISLHVGSDDLIDSRILDKTESLTAVANQIRFVYASPSSRFEFKISFLCIPPDISNESKFCIFAPLISVLKLSPIHKTFLFSNFAEIL